jgi:hypothetical protein
LIEKMSELVGHLDVPEKDREKLKNSLVDYLKGLRELPWKKAPEWRRGHDPRLKPGRKVGTRIIGGRAIREGEEETVSLTPRRQERTPQFEGTAALASSPMPDDVSWRLTTAEAATYLGIIEERAGNVKDPLLQQAVTRLRAVLARSISTSSRPFLRVLTNDDSDSPATTSLPRTPSLRPTNRKNDYRSAPSWYQKED